jgi:hypothetical protein
MSNPTYALILAGGSGERFWPLSRRARPKQLLRLRRGYDFAGADRYSTRGAGGARTHSDPDER